MIYVSSLEYVRRGEGRGVNKAKSFLSARDVHTSCGHVGEVVSPEASFTCDNAPQSVNTLFAHLKICIVTVGSHHGHPQITHRLISFGLWLHNRKLNLM